MSRKSTRPWGEQYPKAWLAAHQRQGKPAYYFSLNNGCTPRIALIGKPGEAVFAASYETALAVSKVWIEKLQRYAAQLADYPHAGEL